MPRLTARQVGEAVAVMGVISSLVFVGLELRDNARAARASAYQELGIAVTEMWMTQATNRELTDLVRGTEGDDPEFWERLGESDRRLVEAFVVANFRLWETVFLQVEQKLLPGDALVALGWHRFGDTNLVRRTWSRVRPRVTPEFAEYIEATSPHLRSR